MTAITQRIQQGIRALLAFTQSVDYGLVVNYLDDQQFALFCQMPHSEQLHSMNVLYSILGQGTVPNDLAVAALMHDVGKSRYRLAIWQKTLVVLIRAFSPQLQQQLSQGDEKVFWQRPFVVAVQHPIWSRQLMAVTQASQCVLWLIEHHADPLIEWEGHDHYYLLQRLQAADDAN